MDHITPIDRFLLNERQHPEKIYLCQPIDGKWVNFTWREVGQQARQLAKAIEDQGLPERSHIGLLSKNCAHWIITDLSIWMAGHISVPLYPTTNAKTINYILNHAEVDLLFVGKLDEWDSQKSGVDSRIKKIEFPYWSNEGCEKWDDFLKDKSKKEDIFTPSPNDICTIIYTSGTTGEPKGVIHTFHTTSLNAVEVLNKVDINEKERFISYLPLSHVAERAFVEMGSIYCSGTVYFAESIETFLDNIIACQPTLFLGVPKIWIKMQQGVLKKLSQKKLDLLLSLPIIGGLIKRKIKKAMGFAEARYFFCGAAILPTSVKAWYQKLDIDIFECYGMTENFAVAAIGLPGHNKLEAIGKIFEPKTKVKISENGEVLIHSEARMQGYFKEPEMTAQMLDKDGWIHSGDQGVIDKDGYLKIVGRTKDAFKTLKGKYITPDKIESLFYQYDCFENVCIMGNAISNPIAVVNLAEGQISRDHAEIEKELMAVKDEINTKLESHEKISHVIVETNNWTVERGLVTPSLKIRRQPIEALYIQHLEGWSNDKTKPIRFFGSN